MSVLSDDEHRKPWALPRHPPRAETVPGWGPVWSKTKPNDKGSSARPAEPAPPEKKSWITFQFLNNPRGRHATAKSND